MFIPKPQDRLMRFSFCINDDPTGPDVATGFIHAADAADALRQLGDAVYQLGDLGP